MKLSYLRLISRGMMSNADYQRKVRAVTREGTLVTGRLVSVMRPLYFNSIRGRWRQYYGIEFIWDGELKRISPISDIYFENAQVGQEVEFLFHPEYPTFILHPGATLDDRDFWSPGALHILLYALLVLLYIFHYNIAGALVLLFAYFLLMVLKGAPPRERDIIGNATLVNGRIYHPPGCRQTFVEFEWKGEQKKIEIKETQIAPDNREDPTVQFYYNEDFPDEVVFPSFLNERGSKLLLLALLLFAVLWVLVAQYLIYRMS